MIESRRGWLRGEELTKNWGEIFRGNGYFHDLDHGDSFTGIYIFQKLSQNYHIIH